MLFCGLKLKRYTYVLICVCEREKFPNRKNQGLQPLLSNNVGTFIHIYILFWYMYHYVTTHALTPLLHCNVMFALPPLGRLLTTTRRGKLSPRFPYFCHFFFFLNIINRLVLYSRRCVFPIKYILFF